MKALFALTLVACNFAWAATDVVLTQGRVSGTPITIGGEEVWPFIDGQPRPYPNGVIWNINDENVPQVIRECMKTASEVLANWVTNPHDPIHKALINAAQYDVPTTFFLWTNDYTRGEQWMQTGYRKAQSWNWQNSFLKWESTVDFANAQGVEVCNVPVKEEVFAMINEEAKTKADQSGREFVAPKWETEAENPKIADPGPDRLTIN